MRIILLTDVKKQGKKGETINVKDGYGNYLITAGKAVMETSGSKKVLDAQNEKARLKEEELFTLAKELKKKLEKMTLEFTVKTGKNDMVFGSVSSKQIASKLKELDILIDKRKILIDVPINTLGVTNVTIQLHKDINAVLKVCLKK